MNIPASMLLALLALSAVPAQGQFLDAEKSAAGPTLGDARAQ